MSEERSAAYQAALNQALSTLESQFGYRLIASLRVEQEGSMAVSKAVIEAVPIPGWEPNSNSEPKDQ